eukprot:gnl/TRDRNA2_/TRDRNA2_91752_c0_seq1.p1 gnl/TRDRNA2_/TRDRNA2_91752_c0~~gnl/TRDRNA2_/TRDRNA2_91752_c0_seq1.p1  ORF type:complete len:320 (+),score=43.45 gnl/TRDRNA2_/TRDRNA2_91752_c0_seq1:17-976(+)
MAGQKGKRDANESAAGRASKTSNTETPRLILGALPLVHAAYALVIAGLATLLLRSWHLDAAVELPASSGDAPSAPSAREWMEKTDDGDGRNCNSTSWTRPDGGHVASIDSACFPQPFLHIHAWDSGFSPAFCKKIIALAEKRNRWTNKSSLGVKTYDVSLDELQFSDKEANKVNDFVARLAHFIQETFLQKSKLDGALNKNKVPYDEAVVLKGTPFVIRYDASGDHAGLGRHKDNSDVSFIVLLSDPADFGGGGTQFDALGRSLPLRQGEAFVFNGQLVHAAAHLTRGRRYVLSGFTTFSQEFLDMKRRSTLKTMVYLH